MFEDKRFNNDNLGKNRFFIPEDNTTGLNDGNDNLTFKPQNNYVPEPEPIKRKEKKNVNYKKILVIFLVILVFILIGGLIFGLTQSFTSPYKVYKIALNEGYNYASSYIKELESKQLNYDVSKDTLLNSGSVKFGTNLEELDFLNDILLNYKINLDIKKDELDASLDFKQNNKKLIDFEAYVRDQKLVLTDSDIFDKSILISNVGKTDLSGLKKSLDYNDILNVIKCVKDYTLNNLDKDKLSKEKDTVTVNGEKIKVNSSIYSLNQEDVKEMYLGIIDTILNDSNTLNSFANIMGYTRKDMKSYLNQLKEKDIETKDLQVRIYTRGLNNVLVGFGITYGKQDVINYGVKDKISETNVIFDGGKVNVISNDKISDVLIDTLDASLKLKVNDNGDTKDVIFSGSVGDGEIQGSIKLVVKMIGDKRKTVNLVVDFDGDIEGEEVKFNLNVDNMTQVGDKLNNVDILKATDVNDLSEDELNLIQSNLEKVVKDIPFINYFLTFKKDLCNDFDLSRDCECNEGICVCKYLDQEGTEQSITCEIG